MSRPADIERMARHRAEFERALKDRCSLAEARRRLARERWAEADRRLAARTQAISHEFAPAHAGAPAERDPQPWMMRD